MITGAMRTLVLLCVALLCMGSALPAVAPAGTFRQAGAQAVTALLTDYYAGAGKWRECNAPGCPTANSDWGTDAATDALYLRWAATGDPRLRAVLAGLIPTSMRFPAPCATLPCRYWSDTAAWDAVTLARIFEATGDPRALARSRAAYRFVARSAVFAAGACPSVPYQEPSRNAKHLKTLETLGNEIKAALLLYRATSDPAYLREARTEYSVARSFFFQPATQLYTVHLRDDGRSCEPVPSSYFASVNGLMIWNGLELARDLNDAAVRAQAVATADAVDAMLSDPAGIFADAGGENDVVEPLVEAMARLARTDPGARSWIVRNARAALGARAVDGSFARFFDGPPQRIASIWESNGGFAIEIAAAALAPDRAASPSDRWSKAQAGISSIRALPVTIEVNGQAVAIAGTMGARCEHHHVHVLVDGEEINDHAGIWQNPTMPENAPVYFAWRWSAPGVHTITLQSDASVAGVVLTPYVLR